MAGIYKLTICWTKNMHDEKLKLIADTITRWFGNKKQVTAQHVAARERAMFAWSGGQLVGIALLHNAGVGTVYTLESLCVEPDFRGEGVGTFILDSLAQMHVQVVLHVDKGPDHDSLVRWYAARGYVNVGNATHVQLDTQKESLLASENTAIAVL